MVRRTAPQFLVGTLAGFAFLASCSPVQAQAASTPPVARAYQAWVNQGITSGRLVRRCANAFSEGLWYPTALPPTTSEDGIKTVYGDLNNDGVTDFMDL